MTPTTLEQIRTVFFAAMANRWSPNVQKTEMPGFPGTKAISFVSGDFRVLDSCTVSPYSNKSTGATTILHQEQPVWVMQYGGWYDVQAVSFLESCLHQTYVDERRFCGGRGPAIVRGRDFTYLNNVDRNDFGHFGGTEKILHINGRWSFGYHWYQGMSLLNGGE